MKVCTDSCLFGAWIANILKDISEDAEIFNPEKILDIGTGTGLLALMLAQKSSAKIDAVEIEENAFDQASENFAESPWASRLKVINADIKEFTPQEKYDLILSNPPFFENDLKSAAHTKNLAKHTDGLLLKDLLLAIERLLKKHGKFALLLPAHRAKEFIILAENAKFYLEEKVLVKQTPAHDYFRTMLLFGKDKKDIKSSNILIRNEEGTYTDEFGELLRDYYL